MSTDIVVISCAALFTFCFTHVPHTVKLISSILYEEMFIKKYR